MQSNAMKRKYFLSFMVFYGACLIDLSWVERHNSSFKQKKEESRFFQIERDFRFNGSLLAAMLTRYLFIHQILFAREQLLLTRHMT